MQLINYFSVRVSLYRVKPDGNYLVYRTLSDLILGNQEYYDILKSKLITKFVVCDHFNVMRLSGIFSDQEFQDIVTWVQTY